MKLGHESSWSEGNEINITRTAEQKLSATSLWQTHTQSTSKQTEIHIVVGTEELERTGETVSELLIDGWPKMARKVVAKQFLWYQGK